MLLMLIQVRPDPEGYYKVFVEIARNPKLYTCIDKILADVKRSDNKIDNFMFTSYNVKDHYRLAKKTFSSSVIDNSYDYTIATNPEAQEILERIKFLNNY